MNPPPPRKGRRGGRPRGEAPEPGRPARGEEPAPERMVVYGRNAVREALRGRRDVHAVWATEPAAREVEGMVESLPAQPAEIAARCGSDDHQGVCAQVDPYPYADGAALLAAESPFLVVLDEITDPQNLGAVCRTAECAGATGVILPERRAAHVTPAVCKASAGAVEHLAIARVRNLADFLIAARTAGCWSFGAAAGASVAYDVPDYRGGVIAVLGAEGRGLRPRVAAACDQIVALPLVGRIESLNVSAAAAVLLYEMLRQRT